MGGNTLMDIPWFLILGMVIIFVGVFWATRRELLKRNEEREVEFHLEEVATLGGFEIDVSGSIWWRPPLEGDQFQTYKQWGEEKVGARVRDEVKSWLMESIGSMPLAEVKARIVEITRAPSKNLDLREVPVHPRVRILVKSIDMKDTDARVLSHRAVQKLRAEGVEEAMRVLQNAGLTPHQAANVLTTLQAVETSGGQIAALMAKFGEIVEVHND